MSLLRIIVLLPIFLAISTQCTASGHIIGHAFDQDSIGLFEMEIHQCKTGESTNAAWARMGNHNGYYEIKDCTPGTYSLCLADLYYFRPRLFSFVPVREGEITPGDFQVNSAYFVRGGGGSAGPDSREARQTFVATGNVVKVTVWYRGQTPLHCSIHDAHTHEQIGPARDGEMDAGDTFRWQHGEVPTVKGQLYYIKLRRPDNSEFSMQVSAGKGGRAYPQGHAYFDGEPAPDIDLFAVVECDDDGLATFYQRHPSDGLGHGGTEVGQTFKALSPHINVVTIFGTAIEGRYAETRFSIHEDGPDGKQIGPAKTAHFWNYRPMGQVFSVTWQPGEVAVVPGNTYYLKATAPDPGIYVFTSKCTRYKDGRLYINGEPGNPDEDLCVTIMGETSLYSSLSGISGSVRDSDGVWIEGASVRLAPWGYTSDTSDTVGEYTLSGVTAGTYAIECSAPGYIPKYTKTTLEPGREHSLDFELIRLDE